MDKKLEPAGVELFLTFQFQQLTQKLNAQSRSIIARYDAELSLVQWRIIRLVGMDYANESTKIRKAAGIDKGQFSKSLSVMLERDLISLTPHVSDGRQSIVALTEKGRQIYDLIGPELMKRNKHLLAALSGRDRAAIHSIIGTLSRAAEETDF